MNKDIKIKIKGIKGDTPTDDQLITLIKPLIPKPIKGDTGVGIKGEDGKTPTHEELLSLIKPLIVIPEVETISDERLLSLITPLIPIKEPIEEKIRKELDQLIPKQMIGSPRIKVFKNSKEMSAPLGSLNIVGGTITNKDQDYTLDIPTSNGIQSIVAGTNISVDNTDPLNPIVSSITFGTVNSVSGTSDRITSTGGADPIIDIASTYAGQSSITTLGTITAGVWNGTAIANANLANSTISGVSLGGSLNSLLLSGTGLTLSGSYNGSISRTIGLNMANANVWTALQTIRLTTKQQQWEYDASNYANITVGSTGTTTFAGAGTASKFGMSSTVDSQLTLSGYSSLGPRVNADSGELRLGTNTSWFGKIIYSGAGSTTLSIDNGYASDFSRTQFRLQTLGTPVIPITLWGTNQISIGTPYGGIAPVNGTAEVNGNGLYLRVPSQTPYAMRIFNNTYSTTLPIFSYYPQNDGSMFFGNDQATSLRFYTNGITNTRMIILGSGNIGIGTVTPATTFHTNVTASATIGGLLTKGTVPTIYGTPYLAIGDAENNASAIQTIGFGYSTAGLLSKKPAEFGVTTNSNSAFTKVDFVWALRDVTTDTTPTEKLRLKSDGTLVTTAPVRLKGYTVATLPAGTVGDTAYVTDALAPAFLGALVGGGAITTTVFHNGTAWIVA